MKKYIFKSIAFLLAVTSLTSCLKDDSLVLDPTKGNNVIEFANPGQIITTGTPSPLYSFSYAVTSSPTLPITISYSGPEAVAPQDIIVKFAVGAQTKIDDYNTKTSNHFVMMGAGSYTLSTNEVVIKAGTSKATFNVTFKPTNFNFAASEVLPITINSASSGIISGNFNTILLNVSAKNIYDGVYSYNGTTTRNSATGPDPALSGTFVGKDRDLITLNLTRVSVVPLWANNSGIAGIDNTYATVDPVTNLVTMASSTNATLANTPGAVNKYDPATKTFTLNFQWGALPNTRVASMKLVYKGERP